MTNRVPLFHENKDLDVRGTLGLNRMTQIRRAAKLSCLGQLLELVDGSSSDSDVARSRAEDNERL